MWNIEWEYRIWNKNSKLQAPKTKEFSIYNDQLPPHLCQGKSAGQAINFQ